MQTIKTAAIVVLLMTVMYSAYVSLTTPPEPLPADVQGLVINDPGTLAIDTSLPDSLGELEINTGESFNGQIPAQEINVGELASGTMELPDSVGSVSVFANADSTDLAGVTSSISDVATGVSTQLTDIGQAAASDVASSTARPNYPNTGSTFQVPDPNSPPAGFSGTPGGVSLPDSNLALTSGTSPSFDAGVPAAQAVSQAAGVTLPTGPNLGLANAIRTADRQYGDGKRKEALATLSLFYDTPNLSGEERSELLSRLDPLAAEVIYSKRHLLEQPYRVGQQETLMDVADRFEVPWQLLANINQIADPVAVLPGTELKVVRGPFRADVDLNLKELTLFTSDLYAGRFPIGVGNDPQPKPGTFTVQDKQTERTFYNASGEAVAPGSRDNPYGKVWIDLGGQLSIHGSPSTTSPTERGCISLAADLADDLFGILSQGSSVTIRR
ncbi:MAG: L,D-transpeptidase family protein [Rubripirellula sp.]